ncbi:MAG TPA: response regulator transcription factor [Burkholderiales bacterium]|nr:response regulator transcription factor [Burkholderiales bacterium]
MHILLLEDGSTVADALCRMLRREGYAVEMASVSEQTLRAARRPACDLVILDLTLRGDDTGKLVRVLEQWRDQVPALVLTAREHIDERVQALELGADCLAEPFAMPELAARVRALMRRWRARRGGRLVHGPLVVDREAHRAYLRGEPLALLPREWAVLEVLLERCDQIVPKNIIMGSLSRGGKPVSANTIETHVSRLRAKVEGAGVRIRTVHRVGYLLEAQPTRVERGS